MARGKRTRLATGVYADTYGISIVVTLNGQKYERRYPRGTPLGALRSARRALHDEVAERPETKRRGTLAADIAGYLQTLPRGRTRRDAGPC